jgi:hypothetical protein
MPRKLRAKSREPRAVTGDQVATSFSFDLAFESFDLFLLVPGVEYDLGGDILRNLGSYIYRRYPKGERQAWHHQFLSISIGTRVDATTNRLIV